MNFYDVLAAEKWGGGIPTINFFDLLFAQSMGGGEQWQTYEGTLPATINANGADMRQYQIYGNTGGVGDDSGTVYGYKLDISSSDGTNTTTTSIYIGPDPLDKDEYVDYQMGKVFRRTAQLFDKSNFAQNATTHSCVVAETATGIEFLATGYDPYVADTFSSGKNIAASPYWSFHQKLLIPVEENETYTIAASSMPKCYITYVNESYVSLSNVQISSKKYLFTTPNGCKFLLFRFGNQNVPLGSSYAFNDIILCKGTIDTSTYIPYLQPTDPPVVLPALPTCKWTTIVDYAGQSVAPERVVFEYAKGGS